MADNDTAYRFKADGDFNGDGLRDRAVVGRLPDAQRQGRSIPADRHQETARSVDGNHLTKNTGFAGPSVLYPEPHRLNWVPCTACDIGATVAVETGPVQTEWVRTDR